MKKQLSKQAKNIQLLRFVVKGNLVNTMLHIKENNCHYVSFDDRQAKRLEIVTADSIYPIEVKKSKDPSKPDKNFKVLNKFGLNVKHMYVR